MPPRGWNVRRLKVVHRELLLVGEANISILHFPARDRIARPDDFVNRIYVLKKRAQTFQSIRKFGGNWIEIDAAALLKICELGDFQAVQHHLPSDTPCAERGRLPVVFFELDVVLAQVNPDCRE